MTGDTADKPAHRFAEQALLCSERALNLLDRSPFSRTYGCFDRYYWHFKTKDFPAASFQMGSEFLARLAVFEHPDNSYFQSDEIYEYARAALLYSFSIQHADGSFDEWYVNERGWAGPTSYVCHALYSTFQIIQGRLSEQERRLCLAGFERAGLFLIRREEGEVLANHFALYLLSLGEIIELTGNSKIEQGYQNSLVRFFDYVSEEGWSLEYDGVDFSYNMATLSFFARLHQLRPESRIVDYCKKSLEFLSYLVFPDGSLGGGLGSRSTTHLYPYALAYWRRYSPAAGAMFNFMCRKDAFRATPPDHQDDHYLFYRLSEYIETDLLLTEETAPVGPIDLSPVLLPIFREGCFEKHFAEAGYRIIKSKDTYLVIAEKRGGAVSVYGLDGRCLYKNYGWVTRDTQGRLHTSLWNGDFCIRREGNQLHISGRAHRVSEKYFSPLKLVIFRLLSLLLARTAIGAHYFKLLIRKMLITGRRRSPFEFIRTIEIGDRDILIEDTINNLQKGEHIYWGGDFTVRYVPQSRYLQPDSLRLSQMRAQQAHSPIMHFRKRVSFAEQVH